MGSLFKIFSPKAVAKTQRMSLVAYILVEGKSNLLYGKK